MTGKTPYELLLGYQPRQANYFFLSAEVCDTPHDKDLLHIRRQACLRIKERQSKQKTKYDNKTKRDSYLLYRTTGVSTKSRTHE
jgi:hypothetical protein